MVDCRVKGQYSAEMQISSSLAETSMRPNVDNEFHEYSQDTGR